MTNKENAVYLSDIKNDNTLITPEQTLERALTDIRSGERKCNKLLVLTLDDTDGSWTKGYYAANVKVSEMVALTSNMLYWLNRILNGDE